MLINRTLQYAIGYSTLSIGLLSWSIYDSLSKSFNSTMLLVELTDGIKLGILINFIVFSYLVIFKLLQILIFGSLRIIELEHIVERLPLFAINLFLNLATGENNIILNVFLIGMAMIFKVFHIIMIDRLDFLNLVIINKLNDGEMSLSQVLKYFASSINFWLNIVFIIFDFYIAEFLVYDVFQGINSISCLLFGFQFAVQGVEALTYFAKLLLGIYEIIFYRIRKGERRNEEEEENGVNYDSDDEIEIIWENKPYYSKGIEIISAILTSISYMCFIYLLTIHSGLSLPLSMLQGTYSSLRKAWIQISQLLQFIESSKRLDSQLLNATSEDLINSDNLCIICREDMHSIEEYMRIFKKLQSPRKLAKKLQCGHILHMGCLKEWLERSDSCPLCRRKVFGNDLNSENVQVQDPMTNAHPGDERIPGEQEEENNVNIVAPGEQQQFQRGLREIGNSLENISNQNNAQDNQSTTPTPTENTEGSSSNQYQTIKLPSSALLPPDWIILPLEKSQDQNIDYKVKISNYHQADLKFINKEPSRDIQVYNTPERLS
ncbi:unnamed protein product [Candida verbasci]|uniref:RING-type E3 ubiquitin transferase n=1 Tax=Candida verbasci TaxID=1227364 RepID=A0A9W4TPZ3_9ASCO|nr:unnamed protein product [Candida verbasci]